MSTKWQHARGEKNACCSGASARHTSQSQVAPRHPQGPPDAAPLPVGGGRRTSHSEDGTRNHTCDSHEESGCPRTQPRRRMICLDGPTRAGNYGGGGVHHPPTPRGWDPRWGSAGTQFEGGIQIINLGSKLFSKFILFYFIFYYFEIL